MGSLHHLSAGFTPALPHSVKLHAMAPMKDMKGKKGAAMTKGALLSTIADECELKRPAVTSVLTSLASIATAEVKKTGIFVIPNLCRIKTRTKPATKAGKREVFGKVVMVKAKPARTIVKAFPMSALKKSI